MKSIGFIEKLKGLSSKELILLGIILSIFLPFYLFVVVLCLYIISLIFYRRHEKYSSENGGASDAASFS
ncbi:O-antigen polymerase family domain protein [Streptococcus pneumoniae 2070108]|nr:O-antigen polymerase family domain protein [Streptococcus pneumoniae 2070108]